MILSSSAASVPALAALVLVVAALAAVGGWAVGSGAAGRARGSTGDVPGGGLDTVAVRMRGDLERLERVVAGLGQQTARQIGAVDASLRLHAEATATLASTTQGLREALANPKARGQWGERMAEDVLRLAGFQEHVNYRKQTAVAGDGRGIPDFTFLMPKGHVLYMDVKFPVTSYLRAREAPSERERAEHEERFLRDVRLRVRELARREYASTTDEPAVDQVLLFLPNESIAAFLLERDPSLVDEALRARVVLCSPSTLLAFLAVIRQAIDNFVVGSTSDQVLALLARFSDQWRRYTESLDVVRRRFESAQKELDQLTGTRRRALERPLRDIDALRAERASGGRAARVRCAEPGDDAAPRLVPPSEHPAEHPEVARG